jgi:hypothetical protein
MFFIHASLLLFGPTEKEDIAAYQTGLFFHFFPFLDYHFLGVHFLVQKANIRRLL